MSASKAALVTIDEAREEIEKISSLVLAARRLMATGALVDLVAIQERVADLCAAVEAMPKDDGKSLMDDLSGLIRRLDRLSSDISEHLEQMRDPEDGKA